jgi:hypothetical protein
MNFLERIFGLSKNITVSTPAYASKAYCKEVQGIIQDASSKTT